MTMVPKGFNINTIVIVCGLAVGFVGWGVIWGDTRNDVDGLIEFRRAAELELRQIDNLSYRVAASERSNASVSQALESLKEAVAQQSGDLRVVREILQRIERQGRASALRFEPYHPGATVALGE